MAELDTLPDDSPLLPLVTSTLDNCLGKDCPFWNECFVVQARQRAQAADVVVVNHHLLLADLALKQEGFGEILPGAQAFIIDEAHQLPALAANFGESFGMRPLQELGRDCMVEAHVRSLVRRPHCNTRMAIGAGLTHAARQWKAYHHAALNRACSLNQRYVRDLETLITALTSLHSLLVPLRSAAAGLDACAARAQEALSRLLRWLGGTAEKAGLRGIPLTTTSSGTN